jgi:hypothetical protein
MAALDRLNKIPKTWPFGFAQDREPVEWQMMP